MIYTVGVFFFFLLVLLVHLVLAWLIELMELVNVSILQVGYTKVTLHQRNQLGLVVDLVADVQDSKEGEANVTSNQVDSVGGGLGEFRVTLTANNDRAENQGIDGSVREEGSLVRQT